MGDVREGPELLLEPNEGLRRQVAQRLEGNVSVPVEARYTAP
jgi:hypothetical protein